MKIAIIAPSPVPFTIGGAENLWWGLLNSINQDTPHQAELVKIPSPERNFWELIDSYRHFSNLDLTHFDLIISGKYPAWMVQHGNHVCYMLHRLRGLYDTYHLTGCPEKYVTPHKEIRGLQEFMGHNQGLRTALKEFFDRLDQLRRCPDLPLDAFQFPGSLAREIVHFLDGIALKPDAIAKYAAISYTVANRANYFPVDSSVHVIYPPSNLKFFHRGNSDYLFTVSRLDGPKRVRLLVEAMQYVKSNIKLKIAGTGPDADSLKQLAGDDQRIVFLGFVNDQQLTALYADALAVLYVPYNEDYGLVTIEAMMSAKPVLTTTDAGGPNEFVRNGETGYCVPPDPQAIAQRIDYLCEHVQEAQQMGLIGRKLVQDISWENTVAKLLGDAQPYITTTVHERKKITVALTFPVFPPRGGGQIRAFHLYRHLARWFDIEFVTFTHAHEVPFRGEIAPGVWEMRIPKSDQHQREELAIEQQVGVPITDIVMPQLYQLTPAYVEALRASTATSDFIVACHPYLLPAIQAVSNQPLWYEAQDVEVALKQRILPDNPTGQKLLDATRQVEQECCQASTWIWVCCQEDAQRLNQIYGVDSSKIVEVPNGVDIETVNYVSLEDRHSWKSKLGLNASSFTALFMGSWHSPNLEAVGYIFQIAEQLPQVNFLIIGSVGLAFKHEKRPANVGFMDVVDDETKAVALSLADVALNPVTFGSGTNLKMLEYFASGVPVISTPIGVRGLGVEAGKHCIVVDIEDFAEAIADLKAEVLTKQKRRVERARQYVQSKFDWQAISQRLFNSLTQMNLV